ncbi:MAG: hypothetical protein Q8937_09765 [Bacteroidota bacterium]|nr:hypothetical protein [Bacteroidota bacterium]
MKITFFLIAFCLVFLRMYFLWTGHWGHNGNNGSIVISSDGDYEVRIKWSGKVKFTDDETAIASITPGGYLKYSFNEKKMTAESNLQGDIAYTLYDGHQTLPLNDSGRKFLAASIREIFADGFDAEGRADRVAARGGKRALLEEAGKFKSSYIRGLYLDRLFKNDSLTRDDLQGLLIHIGELDGDYEKEQYLKRFSAVQLEDTVLVGAWLGAVENIHSDDNKKNLLIRLIKKDSLSNGSFNKVLDISETLGGDWDKENVLGTLIDKGGLSAGQIERVLEAVRHLGPDPDKENMYRKLIARDGMMETEWENLIGEVALIGPDYDKSNLLVQIAREMPRTDNLKAAYVKAARTIGADPEYGRAMRAIQ